MLFHDVIKLASDIVHKVPHNWSIGLTALYTTGVELLSRPVSRIRRTDYADPRDLYVPVLSSSTMADPRYACDEARGMRVCGTGWNPMLMSRDKEYLMQATDLTLEIQNIDNRALGARKRLASCPFPESATRSMKRGRRRHYHRMLQSDNRQLYRANNRLGPPTCMDGSKYNVSRLDYSSGLSGSSLVPRALTVVISARLVASRWALQFQLVQVSLHGQHHFLQINLVTDPSMMLQGCDRVLEATGACCLS